MLVTSVPSYLENMEAPDMDPSPHAVRQRLQDSPRVRNILDKAIENVNNVITEGMGPNKAAVTSIAQIKLE